MPSVQEFSISVHLPEGEHYVLWRKVLDPKRTQRRGTPVYDKVPHSPSGYRISHSNPAQFLTLQEALQNLQGFHGIGLCFHGQHEVVGVDLDHVLDAQGNLNPHHAEVLRTLPSWTEWSQSGQGLHILCRRHYFESLPLRNFKNHDQGVELFVNSGFLALTLRPYYSTPVPVQNLTDGLLWLQRGYGSHSTGDTPSEPVPVLLEFDREQIPNLHLPQRYKDFLLGDDAVPWKNGDRSRAILSVSMAMLKRSWTPQQVLTVLCHGHPMVVALEHRRGDWEAAEKYLWGRVLKAKGRQQTMGFRSLQGVRHG